MNDFAQNQVYFEELAAASCQQLIRNGNYSKLFLLVDSNTKRDCMPWFLEQTKLFIDEVIEIQPGEAYKTIDTCSLVWKSLSELGADRKSLLINLGGGVLTDLGGFVASTFKRGMSFLNIPTTLLAMVDASTGGKTGVDFGMLKNQIGVINQPEAVLIWPHFLETLPAEELKSGLAEMLKHALIADATQWNTLKSIYPNFTVDSIASSVAVKQKIVEIDPFEENERKKLNFGHTLGHAIESYFLDQPLKKNLLHGEAIAVGMVMESYLSYKLKGLSKVDLREITKTILQNFEKVIIAEEDIPIILALLKHDKKNSHGKINFTLLTDLGNSVVDVQVPYELLMESFAYYKGA